MQRHQGSIRYLSFILKIASQHQKERTLNYLSLFILLFQVVLKANANTLIFDSRLLTRLWF